jgi:hypothetical protein
MRRILLATAAVLGLIAGGATAQTSRTPPTPDNSPEHFLQTAQDLLSRRQNAAARVALENAETRLLDRSVNPSLARQPDSNPQVQQIAEARRAIDRGDVANAKQLISQAMSTGTGGDTMSQGSLGPDTMNPRSMGAGGMGPGGMGPGGMGSGGMGSRQAPMYGSDVPGQASPMNEGTPMQGQPGMTR